MPRTPTPTFVHEMPLRVERKTLHAVMKRFEVAHFPYNVVLQTMLRRLDAMRADARYGAACKLPRNTPEARAARATAFGALRKAFCFSEYAAHEIVAHHIRASHYLNELIDSHTAQSLASRAFDACEQYALGARGRPRFKRRGAIASIEGKSAKSPLKWQDDHVEWGGKRRSRTLTLHPVFDLIDTKGVEAYALASRIKYVRLVRREIRGAWRLFVQLVCEGQPLARFTPKTGEAAIDLGPSTAAIVSHDKAALVSFLPELKEYLAAKRRLQRALDRSRRATNPQCFNANGTWRRGQRQTVHSARYQALRAQIAEQERVMATRRNREHGRLSNIVLRDFGTTIKTEKLSRRAWQKNWGRRMKATAPAMFMEKTHRKAENAGGGVIEFSAGRYRLSQLDHTQGDFVKKSLALRWHTLRDGSGQCVQRDLYSAWLALFVQADGWDASRAKAAWAVVYPLLARAAPPPVKVASKVPLAPSRPLEGVGAARTQEQSAHEARSRLGREEFHATL